MASTHSVFAVKTTEGRALPVLVLDAPTGCEVCVDVARYVRVLANRGDSFAKMSAACRTLGFLHDFYVHAYGARTVEVGAIPTIVAAFLRARRSGTAQHDGVDATGLRWSAVQRETVSKDRYYLAEFSDFCLQNDGNLPLGRSTQPRGQLEEGLRRLTKRGSGRHETSLLHHISHRRRGRPIFGIDLAENKVIGRRGSRSKHFPPPDVIDAMIDRTSSIVQKMMLIEGFFGGPRLSEMLNQWRCDVLPGRLRKSLFPDDEPSSTVLIILAHPSQATYVGIVAPGLKDRLHVLRSRYGLNARHLIKPEPMWAGWKGMQFDEQGRLISQVFWSDLARAAEYERLHARLRAEVYPLVPESVLRSHPYLYINDCPYKKEFGLPIKLSNARKIFQRAAARAGWSGHLFKDGSHASRHAYKAALRRLGLGPEDISKCMHHISPMSQIEYALSLSEVRAALEAALRAPNAGLLP